MNDLVSLIVALTAVLVSSEHGAGWIPPAYMSLQISERAKSPTDLSFGWQRARLLGAFFNGVFLLALGISIFLQTIERFITIEREFQISIVVGLF